MLGNYSEHFPRYSHSHSMLDRETRKRYVSGNWVRIKTSKGQHCTGIICYIGSKLVYLGISPLGTDGRTIEKIDMKYIVEVEEIEPMWLEAGF